MAIDQLVVQALRFACGWALFRCSEAVRGFSGAKAVSKELAAIRRRL